MQALHPAVDELVQADRLAAQRVESLGSHAAGGPGDHGAQVGPLDQGVHVYLAYQVVDVDPGQQRFEVHLGQHGVYVQLVEQGVQVHLFQDRVDVHAVQQRIQVDAGGEFVHVQRADQEIDDTLGHLLGDSLHRISPACRLQPVARIHHGASIGERSQVAVIPGG